MGYIFMYLVLMVIASALAIRINKKIDLTIFLTIAAISIVEYIVGLFTTFIVANVLVFITFVMSLIYLVCIIKQRGIKELKQLITPGSIMLSIIYIISVFLYDQKMVTTHNEVGAWALMTKNFRYYHELTKYNSNMIYSGYLPLVGIWQYFATTFFKEFKDGYLYIAHALLQYSMVIALTSVIEYKNILQNIIVKITMIASLFMMCYMVFTTLFLEPTIGLAGILTLIYIIFTQKIDGKELGIITLMLAFMVLIKDSAALFTIIAAILLFVKLLFVKAKSKTEKLDKKRIIAWALILIMTVAFLRYTWNMYVSLNNLNISADTNKITLENITKLFKGEEEEYKYNTIKAFFKFLVMKNQFEIYGLNVPFIWVLVIAIITMVLAGILKKDKRYYILACVVALSSVLFLIGTLGTYIFVFARWEAEALSALVRYIKIPTIICTCAIGFAIFNAFSYKTTIGVCAIILIAIIGDNRWVKQLTDNKRIITERVELRTPYQDIEKYRHLLNEKDKIYFVTEYPEDMLDGNITRELDLLRFKYQIAPFKVGMVFDTHVTKQDIINKIKTGYTYMYFHRIIEETANKYQFLLDGDSLNLRVLYKIVNENDRIKLVSVD